MAPRAFSVGLTGGLASGKSTVADRLRQRGVPVLDADAVVHGLYDAKGEGVSLVADLFGDGVLKADQSLPYGEVESLIAALENAGAPRIALATRPKEGRQ